MENARWYSLKNIVFMIAVILVASLIASFFITQFEVLKKSSSSFFIYALADVLKSVMHTAKWAVLMLAGASVYRTGALSFKEMCSLFKRYWLIIALLFTVSAFYEILINFITYLKIKDIFSFNLGFTTAGTTIVFAVLETLLVLLFFIAVKMNGKVSEALSDLFRANKALAVLFVVLFVLAQFTYPSHFFSNAFILENHKFYNVLVSVWRIAYPLFAYYALPMLLIGKLKRQ
ncbi:hypothetical protein Dip510_001737 [Elusimicrobium posterum]|uniref:hypothetical protein n=1 Tax=Elusimicrobium posterum TaxID=3116653 RepID=UPI003C7897C3